jgi:hypothetical protein
LSGFSGHIKAALALLLPFNSQNLQFRLDLLQNFCCLGVSVVKSVKQQTAIEKTGIGLGGLFKAFI